VRINDLQEDLRSAATSELREDPLIESVSFNSDDYPESERSDAYQMIVAGPARLTALSQPFYARIDGFIAGPVRFHYVEAVPHRFERSRLKIAMDSADYLVVQHVIEGAVEGDCDGKPLNAPAGSVYCLDFRQPSLLVEKGRTRLHFVTVNRQVALDRLGDIGLLHGAVFSQERAAAYISHLEKTYGKLATMRRSHVRGVVNETLDELAALFCQLVPATAETLLERAKAHVARRLGSRDLTPEGVATALGVSRSQLYLLFRDSGGVSKYIWNQRLEHLHAALSTPSERRSLTELSLDFGFTSQAHLSSLFRKSYGEAPSRVRQRTRAV
jgi:AraC-like DNA-binding protein